MKYENKIATLVLFLAIIFGLFGFFHAQKIDEAQKEVKINQKDSMQHIELTKKVNLSSTRNIISEKFLTSNSKDGKIIVASGGSFYEVSSGTVLIDEKIVKVSKENAQLIVLANREEH